MPSKTFPDFGKELRRPFAVDERCYDCAEFYDGCPARRENPDTYCLDYLGLPDVMPGTTGQVFPPSRLQGRPPRLPRWRAGAYLVPRRVEQEPTERGRQPRPEPKAAPPAVEASSPKPPASQPEQPNRTKVRICGCGVPLPKGRRLCDGCRTQNRRQTKREYMRTYMEQRRSAVTTSDSDVPFPAAARPSVQASGDDLRANRQWEGGGSLDPTSVLTKCVL